MGSAYGLYHFPQPNPSPVDTNAIVVIDAGGVIRAVETRPDGVITAEEIATLVHQATGGAR